MREVVVVIGPGQIGQAIARRIGIEKRVLLADQREENAKAAAEVLGSAGYDVTIATVDVASRQDVKALVETARGLGQITGLLDLTRDNGGVDRLDGELHPGAQYERRRFEAYSRCATLSKVSDTLPRSRTATRGQLSVGHGRPRRPLLRADDEPPTWPA